ncbi:MAG: hypothetical protein DME16_01445, partial [Candidatus Rokuibacteriota bacterium]
MLAGLSAFAYSFFLTRLLTGVHMHYMIIERFRDGNPLPVYRRFREQGRLAPEGLRDVTSWVTEDLGCCFQVMECEDPQLLTQWT